MDAETEKKVEELAMTLKGRHLAASLEEARERAKQIILWTEEPGMKETLKEAMKDENKV